MTRIYIRDLQPGQRIENQIYLLTDKQLRGASNGSFYISANISDRTGKVPARLWQAGQALFEQLPADGFVSVTGRAETYKNITQFIIEAVRILQDEELARIDPKDFLPHTERDIDEMFKRVLEILRTIKDRHILLLIKQFVSDEPLMEKFKTAPAAVSLHHARVGGLLEHTLNLLELAVLVGPRYEQINMDLLLAGTFLHDIGKVDELLWDTAFKYTDEGMLVGHLTMAVLWVHQRAEKVAEELGSPFPDQTLQQIKHMILSHHGQYEFGSPKLPMTAEAVALHYLDNLDAKLEQVREQIQTAPDTESKWTPYVRSLERRLYKPQASSPESNS